MMTTQISATFEIGSWDETPFDDGDSEDAGETKLTEALVTKRYSGELVGSTGAGKFRADPAGSLSLDLDG